MAADQRPAPVLNRRALLDFVIIDVVLIAAVLFAVFRHLAPILWVIVAFGLLGGINALVLVLRSLPKHD